MHKDLAGKVFPAGFSAGLLSQKSLVGHVQMAVQRIFRSFVLIINCRPPKRGSMGGEGGGREG